MTHHIRVVFSFLDSQIDGFSWDKPVGEDFLDGGKSDTPAVISMSHSYGQGIHIQTLVHNVTSLGGQFDEVIKVSSS